MVTTLYVIRHGETVSNAKGLTTGQQKSPLTENGEHGTKLLAEKLNGITFDKVYASNLPRAINTVTLVLKNLKMPKFRVFLLQVLMIILFLEKLF